MNINLDKDLFSWSTFEVKPPPVKGFRRFFFANAARKELQHRAEVYYRARRSLRAAPLNYIHIDKAKFENTHEKMVSHVPNEMPSMVSLIKDDDTVFFSASSQNHTDDDTSTTSFETGFMTASEGEDDDWSVWDHDDDYSSAITLPDFELDAASMLSDETTEVATNRSNANLQTKSKRLSKIEPQADQTKPKANRLKRLRQRMRASLNIKKHDTHQRRKISASDCLRLINPIRISKFGFNTTKAEF